MSGLWMTPNNDELDELLTKCNWQYVDKFDITGWKVTVPNGNFIFIPVDKNNDYHILLTSLASFDESKENSTELGRTKFAQFLELYVKSDIVQTVKVKELDRLRVGYIRPATYGEKRRPGSTITAKYV